MNFESIISYLSGISALKWILMILLTGFIAQFGKIFAEYLIRKAGKKNNAVDPIQSEKIKPESCDPDGAVIPKNRLKADKKEGKTERKKIKKMRD